MRYAPWAFPLNGRGDRRLGLFELDGYYPGDICRLRTVGGILPSVTLTNVLADGVQRGCLAATMIEWWRWTSTWRLPWRRDCPR